MVVDSDVLRASLERHGRGMPCQRKVAIGVIGLGNVAIAHLEAYRHLSCVKVVAGADPRKDRLADVAASYGFKPYERYEEMLSRERLDVACVFTPARTHRMVTEEVAKHKVHVLCEKPMAVSVRDANAMISICETNGVKFFYGASYRFLPALIKARELIQGGEIGHVQLLTESMIGGRGPNYYKDMGPGHYEIGGPGGSDWGLLDHGIHLADSFSWLMNSDIASVFGRGALSGGGPLTEYLVMNFENGALGTIVYNSSTFSSDLPAEGIFSWSPEWTEWKVGDGQRQVSGTWAEHPASIRVHGTHGALRIYYYANKMFLFAEGRREQIQVLDQPMPRHFGLQMQSFAQSILDDRSPETNGWDGVKALRAVLGAYESSKKQRVIFVGTDSQAILREHDSRDFKKGELA